MSQRAEIEKTRPGDPYPCPKCGESDWVAHYKVPESQGIALTIGKNGKPDENDYDGCIMNYDPDETEWYECSRCGQVIILDGTPVNTPLDWSRSSRRRRPE